MCVCVCIYIKLTRAQELDLECLGLNPDYAIYSLGDFRNVI